MAGTTILSDFLEELDVPHTGAYTDGRFHAMPFKSLFGMSRLLGDYGVATKSFRLADKRLLEEIPVPFLAQLGGDFVIVTAIGPEQVDYLLYHKRLSASAKDFADRWTGVVLQGLPAESSAEPDFGRHRLFERIGQLKFWLLVVCAAVVLVAGAVSAGLFRHVWSTLQLIVGLCGLGVTWLLILKTLRVASHSADKICGVLQRHGCDTVLEQKASTFFGVFSWSELGLSYFAVTLAVLLLFPHAAGMLALINGLCLPFTLWSIWYQRFRIHTWCTLCVCTQCLLWLQFFCYLGGGCWHDAFPLQWSIVVLGAAYCATLLGVNRVMTFIKRRTADGSSTGEVTYQ